MKKLQIVITIILLVVPVHVSADVNSGMDVHFIDVGQGDSIFIETPLGKNILIDGGPPNAGKKVVQYLRKQKVKDIDLLIATHPDYDHIGGLSKVMKSFNIKQILDTGKIHLTKSFLKYVSEIRKQDIPTNIADTNQEITIDPSLKIKVLNDYHNKSNNGSSIVLKVSYGEVDFLLMGDAKMAQEEKLIEKYDLESEIIKIGHHGSDTSTSYEFIKEVNPETALLSYGIDNNFGHPVGRVINNLNRVNANIYSTAVYGDVVISTDGKDYYVFPDRSPLENIIRKSA
ncbi:MBL fold metallo-hydrolase [Oceanobacillus senegalensis]|uniref:ComEC/Rec2 family competence protein n=1 Tax=Oceanobacillus senegalensis TaxID=1936063 RepID=UPI000A30C465